MNKHDKGWNWAAECLKFHLHDLESAKEEMLSYWNLSWNQAEVSSKMEKLLQKNYRDTTTASDIYEFLLKSKMKWDLKVMEDQY